MVTEGLDFSLFGCGYFIIIIMLYSDDGGETKGNHLVVFKIELSKKGRTG